MRKVPFIVPAEFAFLPPREVLGREGFKPEGEHPAALTNLHIVFRRTVSLEPLGYTRFYMELTADDYYKLSVNGRFAAQGPAQGYVFGYNWNRVDVSDFIRDGGNEFIAEVYYHGCISRAFQSGDLRCGLMACLIGERPDGTEEVLMTTDREWFYAYDRSFTGNRTFGYKTQFAEDRDLRIRPGEWERAREKEPDYTFAAEPVPVVQRRTVTPVETLISETEEGIVRVYDFGEEITGQLCFSVTGHAGQVIELRAGEELEELEGSAPIRLTQGCRVRYKNRANCDYQEFITLAEGGNTLEQYDYKPFRYAELISPPDVQADAFGAVVRHWPFDENACVLKSSDTVLEQVFDICKRGVKLGSQEVYVDCPGREKGQYAGDLTISSASQLWLTGDTRLFVKAVRNQVESTRIDEGIMAVTPGSLMQEIADYSFQFPILALRYHDFTGDEAGLREMLGVCDRMLTYFEKYQREDGLLDGVDCKWNLVDWPKNLRDGYDFPLTTPIGKGVHNVINAFYIGAVICTEEIIDRLGIRLEEGAKRSDALIEAYNRCFFRAETGLYADSETSDHASLHSNILPLYFGFAKPESHDAIARLIRSKGIVCGVYMSYFLLKALCRLGLYKDVYELITSQGENSWYNMVREGGTTCFEAWGKDKKWNTSLCHPWASAPISVLIEDLLGISPAKPGFAEVDVRPHLPASLENLEMRIPLPDGRHLEFEWERGVYSWRLLKNEE